MCLTAECERTDAGHNMQENSEKQQPQSTDLFLSIRLKHLQKRLKSEERGVKRSVEVCRIRKHGTLVCAVCCLLHHRSRFLTLNNIEGMAKEQVVMIQETGAEVLQFSPHLSRKT